jgi:hypothetical protein
MQVPVDLSCGSLLVAVVDRAGGSNGGDNRRDVVGGGGWIEASMGGEMVVMGGKGGMEDKLRPWTSLLISKDEHTSAAGTCRGC